VRQGGGLIAAGDAAALPAIRPLMPGVASAALPETAFGADTTSRADPRRSLAVTPLIAFQPGAVAVESRGHVATVAAQRVGAGRVLQMGYLDTWRWRMEGVDPDPVRGYRQWWSAMVSSVAYAPGGPVRAEALTDPTPLATMVATLGTAAASSQSRTPVFDDPRLTAVLFGIALAALAAEWASRRLQGRS
jgi:hypothetical protein